MFTGKKKSYSIFKPVQIIEDFQLPLKKKLCQVFMELFYVTENSHFSVLELG